MQNDQDESQGKTETTLRQDKSQDKNHGPKYDKDTKMITVLALGL